MNALDIIIASLPFLSLFALWLFRLLERRLPAKQRAELDEIIQIAVQAIEQQGKGLPGTQKLTSTQKKTSAISIAMDLCEAYKVKKTSVYILEILIESAVHVINRAAQPPDPPTPEPIVLSTGPLPIPPAPTTSA